jgi:ferredoxin-NADP reductase
VDSWKETSSARTLRFDVPGWSGHLPGQHVDIRLTAEDGYTAQRSYSLSAPADGAYIELSVQSVADGEVSPYLVHDMANGDQLEVRGPFGGWFVWRTEQREPVLLVGGGSGVAPLMAIVRAHRAATSAAPLRLIYSARTPADVYFAKELDGEADVAVLFTRTTPEGDVRPPHRIDAADLVAHGWPADRQPTCYVCGPTSFVEAVTSMLIDAGHMPARIRAERFGSTGG